MKNDEFDREELQSGWVKFTRFYFKEGWIDRWIGDFNDNPNSKVKDKKSSGSRGRFYRLNSEAWEPDGFFDKTISKSLSSGELRKNSTARDVYKSHFTGAADDFVVTKQKSDNMLGIKEIQNIISSSFTNKDMIQKLNNLLISKEIKVIDSVIESLDTRCDSYSRIVRSLTEMRGDAVARQTTDIN